MRHLVRPFPRIQIATKNTHLLNFRAILNRPFVYSFLFSVEIICENLFFIFLKWAAMSMWTLKTSFCRTGNNQIRVATLFRKTKKTLRDENKKWKKRFWGQIYRRKHPLFRCINHFERSWISCLFCFSTLYLNVFFFLFFPFSFRQLGEYVSYCCSTGNFGRPPIPLKQTSGHRKFVCLCCFRLWQLFSVPCFLTEAFYRTNSNCRRQSLQLMRVVVDPKMFLQIVSVLLNKETQYSVLKLWSFSFISTGY